MDSITVVFVVAVLLISVAFYACPVDRSARARLLRMVEDDPEAQAQVDRLVARKWLTFAQYESERQRLTRRRFRRLDDDTLARSRTRNADRDGLQPRKSDKPSAEVVSLDDIRRNS